MADLADILLAATVRGTPVTVIAGAHWEKKRRELPPDLRAWADVNGFKAQPGRILVVPGPKGAMQQVLAGEDPSDPFALGRLSRSLPPGSYCIGGSVEQPDLLALGWCLESYSFGRYGKASPPVARLVCPKGVDRDAVLRAARASWMVRDLVNTPASDMGPDELEQAARVLARSHRARVSVISGKALERGFPMIHAVGKASPRAPRLIDFTWGPAGAPRITLVGKGVCFDTGGLDIKPPSGMAQMKKDMGGAATVLGLAQMIMAAKLRVRLRVLIPAVENAIAGNAFRPGDVLKSRKGITVEIGNTDAEGRLVLGDALALADEDTPDLLVDMATLTGAARVALGPDLPPFYTDDEGLAEAITAAGRDVYDPVWRLPFWQPYNRLFESSVADMNNAGDSGFAGSITAALFLKRFVENAKAYVHFDIFAWAPAPRPGRPKGGEAQAMRAVFEVIRQRVT
ncbi:MAG: leucyl aminopeptidase family protein [Hyphomicrobiales bacterium]|uniref:leucyl aminopeptidase family protein n=1 Tax=Aestuariivirga sp. TaxID=2650926 RepID=UPI0035ADC35D